MNTEEPRFLDPLHHSSPLVETNQNTQKTHCDKVSIEIKMYLALHVGTGVTTYALHPGVIITEIIRHMEHRPIVKLLMDTAHYHRFLVLKDVVHGAQTTICCAVDEKLKDESSKYYRSVNYNVRVSFVNWKKNHPLKSNHSWK